MNRPLPTFTLMWRHDYRAAEDNNLVAVRGWLDGTRPLRFVPPD